MQSVKPLTIQDYFRRSQAGGVASSAHRAATPPARGETTPFSAVLSAARSAPPAMRQGWTIRDYFAQPMPHRRTGVSGAAASPGNRAPSHPVGPQHPQPSAQARPTSATANPLPRADRDGGAQTAAGQRRRRIQASIDKAAMRYDLPPVLIEAVIRAESNFDSQAVSPAGAQGLMQLMPQTARELGVTDAFDVDDNIDGGTRYLRSMLDRFDGDLRLALSAYNAGPGTVARYNGEVPYTETRNYVRRVLAFADLEG